MILCNKAHTLPFPTDPLEKRFRSGMGNRLARATAARVGARTLARGRASRKG